MISKQRMFNGLSVAVGVGIAALIGIGIYSQYIEQPFLYYQNLPFPLDGYGNQVPKGKYARVYPGNPVELNVERCSLAKKTMSYKTTHSLRNEATGVSTMLPNLEVAIEPGCHRSISKVNVIPAATKPGIYSVWGVASAEGLFKTHKIDWYSETFEVVPPKEQLVIITGEKGDKGDKGTKGPKGEVGPAGVPGVQGATGAKGSFWGNK
jgi:hypothetical protein